MCQEVYIIPYQYQSAPPINQETTPAKQIGNSLVLPLCRYLHKTKPTQSSRLHFCIASHGRKNNSFPELHIKSYTVSRNLQYSILFLANTVLNQSPRFIIAGA